MLINELGMKLKEMYEIKGANKVAMIHLFGILYAQELERTDINILEVIKAAQMPESYRTEINKGVRLSKYVELKPEYKGKF